MTGAADTTPAAATIDVEALMKIGRAASQAGRAVAEDLTFTILRFTDALSPRTFVSRVETRLAGIEARYYTHAALALTTTAGLDMLTASVLHGQAAGTGPLTPAQRARVAAAALAGFVEHHDAPAAPTTWHRHLGDHNLQVRAG